MISRLAHLKATAMSAPFLAAFAEQSNLQANFKDAAGAQRMDVAPSEKQGELMVVKYREEEAMYIQASHDRVTVIFSTVFKEEADRVYGRVFLQVRGSTSQMHIHQLIDERL
jgi:actin related protein 2/3 complex subunit 2